MNHNRLDPIALSSLKPHLYSLDPDRPAPLVRCPYCPTSKTLFRKMMPPHYVPGSAVGQMPRTCKGSGQRFVVDVSVTRWVQLVAGALESWKDETDPDTRRAGAFGRGGRRQGRVMRKPQPPQTVPVFRPVAHVPAAVLSGEDCSCPRCQHPVLFEAASRALAPPRGAVLPAV